ncbi:MAG: GDP-mannose 4,6-dehydratase [Chloroflexi bacterium]|nr:GDP-mannose 4,6-dehydratase [Chloroflexota bacterium]
MIKEGSHPDARQAAWHWNPLVRIAVAPGVSCFKAGQEYAHGSLSLQECLTPTLLVRASAKAVPQASIQEVKWINLRCRVTVETIGDGAVALTPGHYRLPGRPGDARKYAIDACKIREELGWKSATTFEEGLRKTIDWYADNERWWQPIKRRKEFAEYYRDIRSR